MTAIAEADECVLRWITNLVGELALLDSFMMVVVNDYFIPVSLSLMLVGLWFAGKDRGRREYNQRIAICAGIAIGLANAFIAICNLFYNRPRPFVYIPELMANVERIFYAPTDSSFPSNMAAVVFSIAVAVWISNRKLGLLLCIPAFLVCFARVFAGVHYPLDILAGAGIGILSAYLAQDVVMPIIEPLIRSGLKLARRVRIA